MAAYSMTDVDANDSRHHLSSLQVLATGAPLEQVRSIKRGDTVVVRGATSAPASQGGTHGEKRFRDENRTFVCGRIEITLAGCTVSAAR